MKIRDSFLPNIIMLLVFTSMIMSCSSRKTESKEEQIRVDFPEAQTPASNNNDSVINSIQGNIGFNQISTNPNSIILTGLKEHRLVTIYKSSPEKNSRESWKYYSSYSGYYDVDETEKVEHFMPGIDILYGYNLLDIAHYDLQTDKLNFLFDHPVLVKTLYYPSFVQDSIDKIPVNRDYYLVSVYDEDTNKDTLINRNDLRRFYYFNAGCDKKVQLIPEDYSVLRSQYDSQNDIMYIFARQDVNKSGSTEKDEPVQVFWISLKAPAKAIRLY